MTMKTLLLVGKPSFTRRCGAALAFAAVALGLALPQAQAGQADTGDVLRKGGYTLYFRHAQSDWRGPVIGASGTPEPCAGERQLTEAGRADARALGLAVKSLNLPIGDISSAGLCRTQETAKIAFGAAKMVTDLAPRPGTVLTLSAQAAAVERLAKPALFEHAIRIIVGDYEVAQALYGVTLAEGDALVLKTGADGRVEPVARVRLADWRLFAPVAVSASATGISVTRKF